ncbi:DUF3822 family protein [Flavobacterium quisquiliarum]|uniref:DUF3822 family protein n=1 Tax=Flavobacterium quisquiliarum TaxID=1834436 RepID=A0ABV8W3Q2_9FLAO|nr:DUF3822 family protein [Flavobacterium quisquiliarum]MBW1655127.1 DUF3822 family protein [Flavobacterium quisquiliarum]NWL02719.1 DUF3822 domain-containing protein [Flavobacterium collinsii]
MSLHNTNITSKNYKKLSIQVSLSGFSYCCFDTLNNVITSFKEIQFDNTNKTAKIEDLLTDAFKKNPELKGNYDDVMVIHTNNLSTFVPTALFDENYLGSYLQYTKKVFETDFFTFDRIPNYEMNSVYIPYVNINNFLIDNVGSFNYRHANTILVEKLLDNSRNDDEKKMVINFNPGNFEIIVVQNQKLLLFNSFEYQTPEDFIYYILFTAEQLSMNPESFRLEFLGTISDNDPFYQIAYKYVRHISFLDVSKLKEKNSFSTAQNQKHYILFQS